MAVALPLYLAGAYYLPQPDIAAIRILGLQRDQVPLTRPIRRFCRWPATTQFDVQRAHKEYLRRPLRHLRQASECSEKTCLRVPLGWRTGLVQWDRSIWGLWRLRFGL